MKTLSEEPIHTVRIAAIGPLTNIAMAFQKDPETFSRLGSLSIMGGSLDGCGNTTPVAGECFKTHSPLVLGFQCSPSLSFFLWFPISEFNFFADPLAAKIIMEDAPVHPVFSGPGKRGLKSFLLPLDITERHVVPYSNMVKTGQDLKNSGILGELLVSFFCLSSSDYSFPLSPLTCSLLSFFALPSQYLSSPNSPSKSYQQLRLTLRIRSKKA